jgi:Peptidase family M23
MRSVRSLSFRLALGALVGLAPAALEAQLHLVPLELHTPKAPTPVSAEGKTRLAYEIWATNLARAAGRVVELQVRAGAGEPVLDLTGADLTAAWRSMTFGDSAGTISGGGTALIYLWVSLPAGRPVPSVLTHRLIVTTGDSTATRRDTLDGYEVAVRGEAPVISPPFDGGPWVAANGPGNTSGHRRTTIPLGGRARIAQRFATDWVKLGPDGRLFHGDSTVNSNWYGWGTRVVAVADGIVTETKDGIPENVPLAPKRAVPITLETVGGNHVIIDLGQGNYAFYAHLQPGSVKVKVGDRVRRGQQIGLLGNTGNSDAPHLHLHLGDANSPLGSEGVPFVFDRFERLGRTGGFEQVMAGWTASGPAEAAAREIPLEDAVVRFHLP